MYNVGIFLFDNIELMDFAGPLEVFSVTSELNDNQFFNVFTITNDGNEIKSVNGLIVKPDYSFYEHPPIDILIIPGGIGTKCEITKKNSLKWVKEKQVSSIMTISVCSGARILAKIGLLDNIEYTTHHEVIEHVQEIAPKAIPIKGRRFVESGGIFTSAGITAGIDLSFYIVKRLYGENTADKTRVYMEYGDWEKL